MGAGSSPSSLSPAPLHALPEEIIVATPKPGIYTRGDITRVVESASEAVRLTRDGWTAQEDSTASQPVTESPKPKKPSTTEN